MNDKTEDQAARARAVSGLQILFKGVGGNKAASGLSMNNVSSIFGDQRRQQRGGLPLNQKPTDDLRNYLAALGHVTTRTGCAQVCGFYFCGMLTSTRSLRVIWKICFVQLHGKYFSQAFLTTRRPGLSVTFRTCSSCSDVVVFGMGNEYSSHLYCFTNRPGKLKKSPRTCCVYRHPTQANLRTESGWSAWLRKP